VTARAAVKAHSTSTSRQFVVYGAQVLVRGAFCHLAERTKANLLETLRIEDEWKTPIVINLDYPQANLPELVRTRFDFSQVGSGLKLQLNLLVTDDLDGREVRRELLRAVLIEMIYRERTNIAAGSPYSAPPDWLIDGILQLEPAGNRDEAAHLLENLIALQRIAPLDEVVRQKSDWLDPTSRKIHDAYALALVQLLIESPDGRRKLVKFIRDLPDAPNDPMANLQVHFPSLLGPGASKWWSLSVAHLSAANRYQILSIAETERRLDRLRHITVSGLDGRPREYDVEAFSNYLKLCGSPEALQDLSEQFLLVSAQANPCYHSIVQELYLIALELSRGKTKHIAGRLTRLNGYRALVDARGRDIDDYMNWFEATQLKTMSGAFSDVLKVTSEQEQARSRRRDSISVYLDSMEALAGF
jgi:hypothetical protein